MGSGCSGEPASGCVARELLPTLPGILKMALLFTYIPPKEALFRPGKLPSLLHRWPPLFSSSVPAGLCVQPLAHTSPCAAWLPPGVCLVFLFQVRATGASMYAHGYAGLRVTRDFGGPHSPTVVSSLAPAYCLCGG